MPTSGVPEPRSPYAVGAVAEPAPYDPYDAPFVPDPWHAEPRITPSAAPRRRTGLRVTIAALAALVVLAGGGAVAWWQLGGHGAPTTHRGIAGPSTSASASSAPLAPLPTASPLHPGIEPPKPAVWPAAWPKFAASDNIRTYTNLDGLGFPVKVPPTWQCTPAARAPGLTQYSCGATGPGPQLGGELTVRTCPAPCDGGRQTAMRRAEEAWGLQWLRIGPAGTYAESSSLLIDGAKRYGLVIVAYFRSGASGAIDRQLVLRMTAPVNGAGQLRRVANFIRDTLIF